MKTHTTDHQIGKNVGKPLPILKRRSSFSTTFNVTKTGPPGKQIVFADDRGANICKV
jgi:hypothetical protein